MISLISAKWVINDVRAIIRRKYITIEMFELRTRDLIMTALAKSIFVFYMIALPLTYLTFSDWLTFFCLAMATSSYNFVLMWVSNWIQVEIDRNRFSVNHLTEDSMFPNDSVYNRDWARLQVISTWILEKFKLKSSWTRLGVDRYQLCYWIEALDDSLWRTQLPDRTPCIQLEFNLKIDGI